MTSPGAEYQIDPISQMNRARGQFGVPRRACPSATNIDPKGMTPTAAEAAHSRIPMASAIRGRLFQVSLFRRNIRGSPAAMAAPGGHRTNRTRIIGVTDFQDVNGLVVISRIANRSTLR